MENDDTRDERSLMIVVDDHEDIEWNMLTFGRDYRRYVDETRRLEAGSTTVT